MSLVDSLPTVVLAHILAFCPQNLGRLHDVAHVLLGRAVVHEVKLRSYSIYSILIYNIQYTEYKNTVYTVQNTRYPDTVYTGITGYSSLSTYTTVR